MTIPLGNFYLGVNTGISYDPITGNPTPETARNVFGWLELDNTGTQLLSLDNAVAYGNQGIIIGTTTALAPEPATLSLALLTASALLLKRRKPKT